MNLEKLNKLAKNELVPKGELSKLKRLIDSQLLLEGKKKNLENELKEVSTNINKLALFDIPNFLAIYGLSRIKLITGEEVTVKSDVNVTIKDFDKFYIFLKERRDDAIVKSVTEITEPTDKVLKFLNKHKVDFITERKIHPQTLNKYFREFTSLGDEEVPKSVSVYAFSKAKIK